MVIYYGYYSNVSLRKRKMQDEDELVPSVLESDESSKERRNDFQIQPVHLTPQQDAADFFDIQE